MSSNITATVISGQASLALVGVALAHLSLAGCIAETEDPPSGFTPIPDAEVRALFIGNSLTASNDLPGMVQTLAEAAGRGFEYRTLLRSSFSLEDHWSFGHADDVVRGSRADFVVLQQGPSSVGDNPAHLRSWTETYAPLISEAGGTAALLMVWPESTRMEAFDAVRDSYQAAAQAVNGRFVPAGEVWREIWLREADAPLYGPDGFHPSTLGTFAAAVSVFAVLFDEDPRGLPRVIVDPDDATLVYEAVHAVHAAGN